MIPRLHIAPVIFVTGWIYLNYYEPLFLPLGLLVLVAFSMIRNSFDLPFLKEFAVFDIEEKP